MEWMRTRKTRYGIGLAHSTQCNCVNHLNGFLRFENNEVIDQMKKPH
jgi:hypothetical protein